MNMFDIVLLAVLLVFAAIGAWRGFVREALSLLTWGVAIAVSWSFADEAAVLLEDLVDDDVVRHVAAFAALFTAVFTTGLLVNFLVNRFLFNRKPFQFVNFLAGGLFGALRGAVVVTLMFLLAGLTTFPQRGWWREAQLAPYFERVALYVGSYIPRDIARHIRYG